MGKGRRERQEEGEEGKEEVGGRRNQQHLIVLCHWIKGVGRTRREGKEEE